MTPEIINLKKKTESIHPIEIIIPKNEQDWLELRTHDITSTEISALFGISPYMTEFELWHRKQNNISVEFEMNERVSWGMRLQDAIAAGIAEEQKWTVRRMEEYIRIPDLRIGASFDFSIDGGLAEGATERFVYSPEGSGLLEVKNVDSLIYKNNWIIDGDNMEAPPHIELQVQQQLLVSGRAFCYLGALVGGNRVILIKREPDAEIFAAIKSKVAAFWASIDANIPPKPDFSKDAETISRLHGFSEPGKVYNAEGDTEILTLAKRWKELGGAMKACEEERDGIKSQLLIKVGDAERVTGDGFSISAGMIGPADVAYHREGYRSFKVNWKKDNK